MSDPVLDYVHSMGEKKEHNPEQALITAYKIVNSARWKTSCPAVKKVRKRVVEDFKAQVSCERTRVSERDSLARVLNALGPGTGRESLGPGRNRPEGVGSDRCLLLRQFQRGGDYGDVKAVKEAMHSIYGCSVCGTEISEKDTEVIPFMEESDLKEELKMSRWLETILANTSHSKRNMDSGDNAGEEGKGEGSHTTKGESMAAKYLTDKLEKLALRSADKTKKKLYHTQEEMTHEVLEGIKNNYRIALGISDDEEE